MKIDQAKVLQAARQSVPLTIKTFTLPHETEEQLEHVLEIFLKEMGQEAIKDSLYYCLRELAVNAKKANTKRAFFRELKLDLANETDYQKGMQDFKKATLDNIDHYLNLQKEMGLYIKIIFHNQDDHFHLYICNNAEMTKKEQSRVYDRIARSRAFKTMEEALATVLDDSEGAGLGLVILVLMLKRMGLSEDAFDIDVEQGETIARVSIPIAEIRKEHINEMSKELVKCIDSLPKFPENIANLQSKISDPDVEIAEIARVIAQDPSLTADLLKLVNSAAFMLPKRVDNIQEAVMIVGLRGLRNLLYSYGAQKVLGQENEKTRALWQHSYRTAYYGYTLAKSFLKNRALLDDVYIGGILHDMGKIVFSSVHPDLINNIQRFCGEKNIPAVLFEDMSAGMNHAAIGAEIAAKWNFPELLVDAIRYHHVPQSAKPESRQIVNTVYIANSLANHLEGQTGYDQMDPEILAQFNITSEAQFIALSDRLALAFKQETQKKIQNSR